MKRRISFSGHASVRDVEEPLGIDFLRTNDAYMKNKLNLLNMLTGAHETLGTRLLPETIRCAIRLYLGAGEGAFGRGGAGPSSSHSLLWAWGPSKCPRTGGQSRCQPLGR